jgi:hypothetical protein
MTDQVTKPVPTGAMATQPVITINMITGLVSAVFAAITLAAPGIDPQWEKIILTIIGAAWPIVTVLWTWHKVYSPATAQKEVNRAALTGEASDMAPPPPTKPVTVDKSRWGINRKGTPMA